MENSQTVINPSTSGIEVSLEISLLPDHEKLVKKYRKTIKVARSTIGFEYLF